MFVSLRDVASLATMGIFLTSLFMWADILRTIS